MTRGIGKKLAERDIVARPPRILEQMVADGLLGRKSGRGFYDWPEE